MVRGGHDGMKPEKVSTHAGMLGHNKKKKAELMLELFAENCCPITKLN